MLKLATVFGNKHAFIADKQMDYEEMLHEAIIVVVDTLINNGETANIINKLAEPIADKFIKRAYVVYPDSFDCPFIKEDLDKIASLISAVAMVINAINDLSDSDNQRIYEEYKKIVGA